MEESQEAVAKFYQTACAHASVKVGISRRFVSTGVEEKKVVVRTDLNLDARSTVDRMGERMVATNGASRRIAETVGLIDGIAFRANVLAPKRCG